MKKIICLTLVFIMLLSVLVSCTAGDEPDSVSDVASDTSVDSSSEVVAESDEATAATTEVTEATTEAETEAPVPTTEYDLSKFKIVYGESYLADIAGELKTQIKTATNLELEVVSSAEVKDDGGYEIIIGRSDRAISTSCFDFVKSEYSTSKGAYYKDGKVQILGVDRITIRDSIKYFVATAIAEGKETVAIPDDGVIAVNIDLNSVDLPAKADPSYIRVITNNIRMCSITEDSGIPATQNRMSELMGAYLLMDPDIIMFQEADKGWYTNNALVKNMRNIGYTYVTTKQDTNPVALFYKTERFKLLESDFVKYDSSMIEGGPYSGRYYTYAVLEEKETGKQIVATSTHFVWTISGVDTKYTELYRQESARQLVAFSESIKTKYPNAVVVMGGDYNSELQSESHRIMTEVLLSSRDTAEKQVNMNYKTSTSFGKKPSRGNPPSVIDHIFYSTSGLTAKHYEVVVSRYSYAYSDHVPVLVDFELN